MLDLKSVTQEIEALVGKRNWEAPISETCSSVEIVEIVIVFENHFKTQIEPDVLYFIRDMTLANIYSTISGKQ